MMPMQTSPPKVTVITPLYNSSAFIRATLDRLKAQTFTNWESILIDDGSTDDTVQVVQPYLADSRFRLVQQDNRGIAGARNTGIKDARGEWICLLDHDDLWLPTKLEKQLDYAHEHNLDLLCTDAFIVTESERWVYSRGFPDIAAAVQRAPTDPAVDVFEQGIRLDFLCASSVMLKRSLFEKHGLLDPEAVPADDYDMWLRCMPNAKVGFVAEPLIEYIVHAGNYSRNEIRMIEKTIHVLQTHRKRHEENPRRLKQFNDSLIIQFGFLFERLVARSSWFDTVKRLAKLAKNGPGAVSVLYWVVLPPLTRRARNSARHRLGVLRARAEIV
jgi:glycosyltransferase involved in cell wall biosynthesis